MKVIYYEPNKKPVIKEVENEVKALQKEVGGYIEVLEIDDDVILVCNEEGKLNGMPFNQAVYVKHFGFYEEICGPFFICKKDGEEFADIDANVKKKFFDEYMETLNE